MSNVQQPTAEQQVLILKARVFDLNEHAQSLQQQVDAFANHIQTLINAAGIQGDENGQIQLDTAIKSIETIILEASAPEDEVQHGE